MPSKFIFVYSGLIFLFFCIFLGRVYPTVSFCFNFGKVRVWVSAVGPLKSHYGKVLKIFIAHFQSHNFCSTLAQLVLRMEPKAELCVCIFKALNCMCKVSSVKPLLVFTFVVSEALYLWIHCIVILWSFGVSDGVLIKCSFPSSHSTILHCLKYQLPPVYFWICG